MILKEEKKLFQRSRKSKEENNLTVLSITHDIDEAANANRVMVMRQGELVREGTPAEILSAGPELIELGLDLPFPEKIEGSFEAARHLCACSVLDRGRNGGLAMDIRFEKVAFTYQPHSPFEQRVLFDIDLEIKEGSYTALVGHTGSGKSTLLQHLNALLKLNSGQSDDW